MSVLGIFWDSDVREKVAVDEDSLSISVSRAGGELVGSNTSGKSETRPPVNTIESKESIRTRCPCL